MINAAVFMNFPRLGTSRHPGKWPCGSTPLPAKARDAVSRRGHQASVRAEIFNLLNHANFAVSATNGRVFIGTLARPGRRFGVADC